MGAVIAICNPKGGTGKTTTAVTLAEQLSLDGARVAVIDLDGQQTLANWFKDRAEHGHTTPFDVRGYPPTNPIEGFLPLVRDMAAASDFLILDLEGVKSVAMTRAMSRAHLVLIPIATRHLDIDGAAAAIMSVLDEQDVLGRDLPYRIVVNRATPGGVPTRVQTKVLAMIEQGQYPRVRAMLRDAPPFDDIFSHRSLLTEQADPQNGFLHVNKNAPHQIARALEDASAVAAEVVAALAALAQPKAEDRQHA